MTSLSRDEAGASGNYGIPRLEPGNEGYKGGTTQLGGRPGGPSLPRDDGARAGSPAPRVTRLERGEAGLPGMAVAQCATCGGYWDYTPCLVEGKERFAPRECGDCASVREGEARMAAQAEERARRRLDWDRGKIVPIEYALSDPWHPLMNTALLQGLMRFDPARGRGIGLWGESGLRKTRMLTLVLRACYLAGHRVAFAPAIRLGGAFQIMFAKGSDGEEARALIRSAHRCEVLLLDDLGKEPMTVHVGAKFYELIEERTAHRKPILWSANMTGDELAGRMDPDQGDKIVRRLLDYTELLHVREEERGGVIRRLRR